MHSGGDCIIQIKLMNQNLRDMARIEVKMLKFIFVFFYCFMMFNQNLNAELQACYKLLHTLC